MKKAALVLVALVVSVTTAHADSTTSISASPSGGSTAGQAVTFTATFTFSCADGVSTHYFVLDGRQETTSTLRTNGQNATEALTTSALGVGTHTVGYHWETSTPGGSSCSGDADALSYSVRPVPAPPPTAEPPPATAAPSPPETPVPSSSPTSVPTPSETASTSPARLGTDVVATRGVPLGPLAVIAFVLAGAAFGGYRLVTFRAQRRK